MLSAMMDAKTETHNPEHASREVAIARQRSNQKLWRLRPQFAKLRIFDELLENEFRAPSEQEEQAAKALRKVVRFAVNHTPYYKNLFARLGLRAEDIEDPSDLRKLPVLKRDHVLDCFDDLAARDLPPAKYTGAIMSSTGTTGRPVKVKHSAQSILTTLFLKQRQARAKGLDPSLIRVEVRPADEVTHRKSVAVNPAGNVVAFSGWRQLSHYFHTGAAYGFNVSDPMEQHFEWLKQIRPHYVQSSPSTFEEWLFANNGQKPVDSMQALICVGSQLPPTLDARLEESYQIPIHISYGLNEIGKVAMRCSAGRYHVHTEHCLIEIVDANGKACRPGETGHLLVTGLSNLAMPLFRYDTGDLAEPAEGPCSCGRTLASFAEIAGRYRRFAGLPERTRDRVRTLRQVIEGTPPQELTFLRRYQIHQDKKNRFTFRLKTVAPIPEKFREAVLKAWAPVGGNLAPLKILEVDEISTSPGGKLLDFKSELWPDKTTSPILSRIGG